jgi:flagellar basal body-associated protein FliL
MDSKIEALTEEITVSIDEKRIISVKQNGNEIKFPAIHLRTFVTEIIDIEEKSRRQCRIGIELKNMEEATSEEEDPKLKEIKEIILESLKRKFSPPMH